tara:strand:- start:795 stop:932 length:138 start_codon:yes stop_codon:yes gene_type:complete
MINMEMVSAGKIFFIFDFITELVDLKLIIMSCIKIGGSEKNSATP